MSVVLGVVTNDYVILSSDTRALKKGDEIYSDSIQKIFKVNDNVVVGFTGDYIIPNTLKNNGYFERAESPEVYLELLFDKIGRATNEGNILVLGKQEGDIGFGGNFNTSDISIQNKKIIKDTSNVWTPILPPPEVDYALCQELYRSNVINVITVEKNKINQIEKIKEINELMIKKIASVSHSVNEKADHQIIIF